MPPNTVGLLVLEIMVNIGSATHVKSILSYCKWWKVVVQGAIGAVKKRPVNGMVVVR